MATLYVVATPIGNLSDITYRAIEVLKNVDYIICEETRVAIKLLSRHKIIKDLVELNEHTEQDSAFELVHDIKDKNQSVALISDCGTPLFADPGRYFVDLCHKNGIKLVPIPGANSVVTAFSVAGFDSERFLFYGWLPQNKDERIRELKFLGEKSELIVLLDTPYRLKKMAGEIAQYFGNDSDVFMGYDLTQESEIVFRGRADDLVALVEEKGLKGEFVMIVDNRRKRFKRTPQRNGYNNFKSGNI